MTLLIRIANRNSSVIVVLEQIEHMTGHKRGISLQQWFRKFDTVLVHENILPLEYIVTDMIYPDQSFCSLKEKNAKFCSQFTSLRDML